MVTENKILINGKEFEVISYMTLDSGNFIVYTDGKQLDDGRISLYVNRVSEVEDETVLEEVNNEELTLVIEKMKERVVNNV
ncbi:MAG: hypothetical protein E7170_03710 [Firmicutes bacterium]|nr:hypothetical protein [Bacillota bacterium]